MLDVLLKISATAIVVIVASGIMVFVTQGKYPRLTRILATIAGWASAIFLMSILFGIWVV